MAGPKVAGDLARSLKRIKALVSRNPADKRAKERNLVEALSLALRIIKLARSGDSANKWRSAIRGQIGRRYEAGNFARIKDGANPFLPVVKLCFPGLKPARQSQYCGFLAYCHMKGWKSATALEEYDKRIKGAWSPKSSTDNRARMKKARPYTITDMASAGHRRAKKVGWPALDLEIDW